MIKNTHINNLLHMIINHQNPMRESTLVIDTAYSDTLVVRIAISGREILSW